MKCLQDKESGHVTIYNENSYSDWAIEVYIMTVIALESFINEVISSFAGKSIEKIPIEIFEGMDLRRKYYYFPLLYWDKTFNKAEYPYSDFNVLVKIRNCLVHYKMDSEEEKKYFKFMNNKKLLIPLNAFTQKISNRKSALWAFNTTSKMAHKLIELSDKRTQILWGSMLSNFNEIDELGNIKSGK